MSSIKNSAGSRILLRRISTFFGGIVAATTLMAILSLSSTAHAQNYVGQAGVANVTALGLLGLDVLNTGDLPLIGGVLNTGNLPINLTVGIPPITTATVLKADASFAQTTGGSGSVTSTSAISAASLLSLQALGASVLDPTVTVGALTSYAYADANGSHGYSKIADLKVGSQVVNVATFAVNGEVYAVPNQTINVLGVKLIINEQTTDSNGKLTVNALRVQASPVGIGVSDIVLGTSQAGLMPAIVPEANTAALVGLALPIIGGVALVRRRKK